MKGVMAVVAVGVLEDVSRRLAGVDVSGLDRDDLLVVTARLRRVERAAEALRVRIAARATELDGDAAGALLGTGEVSGRQARREADRAVVADEVPALGDALNNGAIGGEHLDAVARARKGLSDAERERFDELGSELADAAGRLPVDVFNRNVHKLVDATRADHGLGRLQQQQARTRFRMWETPDGMGHVHGDFDPVSYAQISKTVRDEMKRLANQSGETRPKGPGLQADALVQLLTTRPGERGGGPKASIVLVVDANTALHGPHEGTVCRTEDGHDVPPVVADRFACDAVIRKVVLDERGVAIDVGRAHRGATPGQRAALRAMYTTCGWTGCDVPYSHTEVHHTIEWGHDGETNLNLLIPLCNRHHHLAHEGGWRITLGPNREVHLHPPRARQPRPGVPGTDPPDAGRAAPGRGQPGRRAVSSAVGPGG